MIHLGKRSYPYMEDVNEGIVRQFKRFLPATGRVLDVGCGRAALGEAIRRLGWEVWGIEQNAEACTTARARIDHLVQADLTDFAAVREQLRDIRFDALVFSDVLEHVYHPLEVLETYLTFVKPGGKVLISVPNMVVWTNRLMLLLGQVRYTDTGVMDRTHIRFFTFQTARALVRAAGCRVDRTDLTPQLVRATLPLLKKLMGNDGSTGVPNPRALIDSRAFKLYMKLFYPIEYGIAWLWRTMFAFRIIVVGTNQPVVGQVSEPDVTSNQVRNGTLPYDRFQERNERHELRIGS